MLQSFGARLPVTKLSRMNYACKRDYLLYYVTRLHVRRFLSIYFLRKFLKCAFKEENKEFKKNHKKAQPVLKDHTFLYLW